MSRIGRLVISFGVALLTANGILDPTLAGHGEHREKERHQGTKRNPCEPGGRSSPAIVDNPTYRENCGSCHVAYQPDLLPSGSWDKILVGLEDHFGEVIELDPESGKNITEYLKANAAEYSSGERGPKIMRSLGNQTSLRITEIPYIQKKHREISPDVLKRKSIGSLSNCLACHPTAEEGVYDDDSVTIPGGTE